MYYIFAVIFTLLITALEGSVASLVACSFILIVCLLYSLRVPKGYRIEANKYISLVYILYVGFAYITSLLFVGGRDFFVSDPVNYIERFLTSDSFEPNLNVLSSFFFHFEGKDVLYIELLRCLCGFANIHLGGATVFYMTLVQTFFGILSAIVLYQLIVERYNDKAFKYSLLFSGCSLFLIYSCLIVRDIIIAYFFLEAIRIVLSQFKRSNVWVLFVLCVLTAGIRMLSGVFLLSFLVVYLYKSSNKSTNKFLTPIIVVCGIIILLVFISTVFFKESMSGLEIRSENMEERAAETGGLINSLLHLPMGIRQLALLLFSQMAPFPPYGTIQRAQTLTQLIIGIDVIVFEVFWFIVFYTLILAIINGKVFRCFSRSERALFFLSLLFLITLTIHPDIRRMMPVYPLFYLLYLKAKTYLPKRRVAHYRAILISSYCLLFVLYVSIKGL